jgi:hypothetical protein
MTQVVVWLEFLISCIKFFEIGSLHTNDFRSAIGYFDPGWRSSTTTNDSTRYTTLDLRPKFPFHRDLPTLKTFLSNDASLAHSNDTHVSIKHTHLPSRSSWSHLSAHHLVTSLRLKHRAELRGLAIDRTGQPILRGASSPQCISEDLTK